MTRVCFSTGLRWMVPSMDMAPQGPPEQVPPHRLTCLKAHQLVFAKPTAASGVLPHDFFPAVRIFRFASPGRPGSQKQQKINILGTGRIFYTHFSLVMTKSFWFQGISSPDEMEQSGFLWVRKKEETCKSASLLILFTLINSGAEILKQRQGGRERT